MLAPVVVAEVSLKTVSTSLIKKKKKKKVSPTLQSKKQELW